TITSPPASAAMPTAKLTVLTVPYAFPRSKASTPSALQAAWTQFSKKVARAEIASAPVTTPVASPAPPIPMTSTPHVRCARPGDSLADGSVTDFGEDVGGAPSAGAVCANAPDPVIVTNSASVN